MRKFQNFLSLIPNHCGPSLDTKTSKFFSHNFSRCKSEKSILALGCFTKKKKATTIYEVLFPIKMITSPNFLILGWCPARSSYFLWRRDLFSLG